MTRKELAAFKRLEKRNDSLFTALCIIKTWLAFPDEQTLWFQVAELCEKHIQEEQAARRKDGARSEREN